MNNDDSYTQTNAYHRMLRKKSQHIIVQ